MATWTTTPTPYVAASDGSVSDHKGTSWGWIISAPDGTRLFKNCGRIFGHPVTSFRAEAFGIASILCFLQKLFPNNCTEKLHLVCDNQSVVNVIAKKTKQPHPDFPNSTLDPDWDIFQYIFHLQRKPTPLLTIAWIRSHQDNNCDYNELPLTAQLNCDADLIADSGYHLPPIPPKLCVAGNPIQVYHHATPVTSKLKRTLRTLIKGPPLLDYVCKKANWRSQEQDEVDWPAHQ